MKKDKIEFETVAEVTGKAQLKDTRKRRTREVFDCTFTPTLKYLLRQEWSMGSGQCPECCGEKPDMGWWTETVGHKPGCELAKAIESAGGKVEWERSNPDKNKHDKLFNGVNGGNQEAQDVTQEM